VSRLFYFHSLVLIIRREARARRGEEEVDPEQFQDPDNEYGLFAGTVYEADDEEADKVWEGIDDAMDSRRRKKRCVFRLFLCPIADGFLSVPSKSTFESCTSPRIVVSHVRHLT